MIIRKSLILPILLMSVLAKASFAESIEDKFSIQDVEIISVSKKEESLFETPSAMYVITSEDIRRSGATSIPEALRMIPGIEVARMDSNKWAITSRGFNRQYANKLLVMVDGVSVYTPHFSGTYWDIQDEILPDVARIEVIRGSGAAIWGANAVNGVINIITKSSESTTGNLVDTIIGTEDRFITSYRHGNKINDDLYYRVYGKYREVDESETISGGNKGDKWDQATAGFRADWRKDTNNKFSFKGNAYRGKEEQILTLENITGTFDGQETFSGGTFSAKWNSYINSDLNLETQTYFDYTNRNVRNILNRKRFTYDFSHHLNYSGINRHDLTLGVGYRFFYDDIENKLIGTEDYISYNPDESYNNTYSAFVNDKITLINDKLFLTLGSKFQHNYFTDFEIQPNARISYLHDRKNSLWAAVSRSIRVPSRGERDIRLVADEVGGFLVRQLGSKEFDSEELVSYEVGYRRKLSNNVLFDISGFFNDYDSLRSFDTSGGLNIPVENKAFGETYGFEISSEINLYDWWDIIIGYNYLSMDLHVDSDSSDTIGISVADENASPKNQFKIRSYINLPRNFELDNSLYYVDSITGKNLEPYIRFDTRLGWKPRKNLDISIVGQNIFDDKQQEFSAPLFSPPSQIERNIYGRITFKF